MKAATGAAGRSATPGDTGGGTAPVSRRQTTRAIVQAGYGSADVLHPGEIGRPAAAGGEVLLVHAAGLDRGTWHLFVGKTHVAGFSFGATLGAYAVGAINDHIVPWHGSYTTEGLLGGEVRNVLSSGSHIADIVNPPGPKAWYEAGDYAGASPDTWRAAASKHKGSWWEDWTAWSDARAGAHVKPPPLGSKRHPALGDAPGQYVRG